MFRPIKRPSSGSTIASYEFSIIYGTGWLDVEISSTGSMTIHKEKTSKSRGSENQVGVSRWYASYSWGYGPVFSCLTVLR